MNIDIKKIDEYIELIESENRFKSPELSDLLNKLRDGDPKLINESTIKLFTGTANLGINLDAFIELKPLLIKHFDQDARVRLISILIEVFLNDRQGYFKNKILYNLDELIPSLPDGALKENFECFYRKFLEDTPIPDLVEKFNKKILNSVKDNEYN